MQIRFDKMEGAGNDFIMVDNRSAGIPDAMKVRLVKDYCRRAQGIGADGMVFLQSDDELDFSWDFFNSDGSRGEMCGNAARCVARFANKIGAAGREMTFRTLAGPVPASLTERGARVKLPGRIKLPSGRQTIQALGGEFEVWSLNTGVPHAVVEMPGVETCEVAALGRAIRNHEAFAPAGTNVNFFRMLDRGRLVMRTYERGVEGETLACGTGAVAVSIVAGCFFGGISPMMVLARSGEELTVHFTLGEAGVDPVFLEGGAKLVFSGTAAAPDL